MQLSQVGLLLSPLPDCPIQRRQWGELSLYLNFTPQCFTTLFIRSFTMFCYVSACGLRGPAWSVRGYSIGPPARGIFPKTFNKLSQLGEEQWCITTKLRTALSKFREFWALIAYFWLAWVRYNHFVNTNFSKLSKEISDPNHKILSYIINNRVINLKVFKFDDKDLWDWEITFHIVAERRAAREERCLSSVRLLLNMCHLIGRHRVIVVAVLNHQVGLKLTVLQ